MLALFVKIPTM